jgi:DDE superfamily endonuclease
MCARDGNALIVTYGCAVREDVDYLAAGASARTAEGYPLKTRIRLLLDNHSAYILKETQGWLSLHPNRFEFDFTPKHGSWLNIVETMFS